MLCKGCNYPNSRVIDSNKNQIKDSIYRRRECMRCGLRFTTVEKNKPYNPKSAAYYFRAMGK